ncbi:hypothetical protein [Winogradskyella rapida]|uniref:O-antigen ligase-like membrane protein n=1 Tax=Winogradskyella rapida TaxID=549701 RepID=A0ABW3KRZ7_9FLAO
MLKQLKDLFSPKNIFPKTLNSETNKILRGLWVIVVFTVFSGALRKWVLGAGVVSNVVLLGQLFLPFIFYRIVSRSKLPMIITSPIIWLVYVYYVCLTAINPMNHTLFHGVFGILLHLGFFMLWLAYLKKHKWIEIERLVPLLLLILVIEFVLASLQYTLPGTHILNVQASGQANNAIVGDAVRVSGTFSYIGGFQVVTPLFACLAWFLMIRRFPNWLTFSVLGLGLLMALMSGSRGAVGFYLLYTTIAFFLSGNTVGSLIKLIVQGFLVIAILILMVPSFQNLTTKSYNNFKERTENSDQIDERISSGYAQILDFKGRYPVFGVGLGATYQGANALFGESIYVKEYGGYESELARIVLEGGFILMFLRIILVLVLLKYTENLPLIAKAFLFVVFMNSMMTFNVYQGVFYVIGVILVDRGYYLRKLERKKINSH